MNPYLFLIGVFALWYIPGAVALYKMEYSLKDFAVVAIRETYIDIAVKLEVKNVSPTNLLVKSLDVSVLLDNMPLTEIITRNVQLPAKSTKDVGAVVRIEPKIIGQTVWQTLLNRNFENSVLTFKGIATANGRPYPFICSLTIKEFVELNS